MGKNQVRIEKNLKFLREQLSRFLFKHYNIKINYKLYANKDLKKIRRFSKITFPQNKKDVVEIDVEYETALKGKRQELLDIAFRSAVRLGLWSKGMPFKEGHPIVVEEMSKYNLKEYHGLPEMGADLHTYSCSGCNKVWILKAKKLPISKDVVEKNVLTTCCKSKFKYDGVIFYDNEKLAEIFNKVNKDGFKYGVKSSDSGKPKNSFDLW